MDFLPKMWNNNSLYVKEFLPYAIANPGTSNEINLGPLSAVDNKIFTGPNAPKTFCSEKMCIKNPKVAFKVPDSKQYMAPLMVCSLSTPLASSPSVIKCTCAEILSLSCFNRVQNYQEVNQPARIHLPRPLVYNPQNLPWILQVSGQER